MVRGVNDRGMVIYVKQACDGLEAANLGLPPHEQGLRSRICDCAPEITRERVIRRATSKDLSDRL
jgi:hypothetical protein